VEWYVVDTKRGRGCTHEVGSGMFSVTYLLADRFDVIVVSAGEVNGFGLKVLRLEVQIFESRLRRKR